MTPRLFSHSVGSLGLTPDTFHRGSCGLSDGFVFSVYDGSYNRTVLTKVGNDGYVKWQREYPSSGQDVGLLLADGVGGVYLNGYETLVRIGGDGSVVWGAKPSYETVHNGGGLSPWGTGGCLYSIRDGANTRIISTSLSGSVVSERRYNGITGEETSYSPELFPAGGANGYLLASRVNVANDYLRLTKFANDLASVTLTKSYKITGSDAYWYLYDTCSGGGGYVIMAFVVGSPAAYLRLMKVDLTGAVTWVKHVTDSGISDFDWSGAEVHPDTSNNGFFVTTYADSGASNGAVIYCFDSSGTLQWSKTVDSAIVAGNSWIYKVERLDNGNVLVSTSLQDTATSALRASYLVLASDGAPDATFASSDFIITGRTGVSVATGTTPTVADDTAGTVTDLSATAVAVPTTLSTTNYPVLALYPDNFRSVQTSGHKAIHHGQASSPYLQSCQVTGTAETKHGIAMSVARTPAGKTICSTVGTKSIKHGKVTGVSTFASSATGHLAAKHGTARFKMTYAVTGTLETAHGSASFASLFKMAGTRITKHGTATTLLSRAMTGHRAIKHGTMDSEWKATGQMTGHLATLHGTASSKCFFKVTPSFKTRHGTHKTIRSITC